MGSTKEVKEYLWGSGVAAATIADYGDVVLAEYTQSFNQTDVTYFRPLYQRASLLSSKQFPTVWQQTPPLMPGTCMKRQPGTVPLNQYHADLQRGPDGTRCVPKDCA